MTDYLNDVCCSNIRKFIPRKDGVDLRISIWRERCFIFRSVWMSRVSTLFSISFMGSAAKTSYRYTCFVYQIFFKDAGVGEGWRIDVQRFSGFNFWKYGFS